MTAEAEMSWVLVVSSIIDFFAQESAGGNILGFFWVFFMNPFAHVSAGSNISCSFRALFLKLCASDSGINCFRFF